MTNDTQDIKSHTIHPKHYEQGNGLITIIDMPILAIWQTF